MKRCRPLVAVSVVAVAAGIASGHGVSGRTGALEAAVQAGIAGAASVPKEQAALGKAAKLLDKDANEKSLAKEIGNVAKAAKAAGALTFAGAAEVQTAFQTAADGYEADIVRARAAMAADATALGLPKKARKKIEGSLAKVTGQIAGFAAAPDVPARLSAESRAAATAAGFTPYDDGDEHAWVISSLELAAMNAGLDLDGDGDTENALAFLVASAQGFGVPVDLDAMLAAALATSPDVGLIEMWSVDDLGRDPLVFAGVFAGTDTDANPSDNFLGLESFSVADGTLAADGHAVVRAATALRKSQYEFALTGQALSLAGFAIPANARVVVQGTVTESLHTGTIGAAIPTTTLLAVLADAGYDLSAFSSQVANLADLDLDGDGNRDAFSAAFTFTTARASIQPQIE